MLAPVKILAYGSLMYDRGKIMQDLVDYEIDCESPFPVEYGRISTKRENAPTLVPHRLGAPVKAQIITLKPSVLPDDAIDLLWRRETGISDPTKHYKGGTGPNNVLVKTTELQGCPVLYVDFNEIGKEPNPEPIRLAGYAIESAKKADLGKDGITYLSKAIECGVNTPLTEPYRLEILRQTRARDLDEALEIAQGRPQDRTYDS